MTPDFIDQIHYLGGTVLGSSRGSEDVNVLVDTLEREGIDILFCVGGDGTQRGASAIFQEVSRRGLRKAIVGHSQDHRQRYRVRLHVVWLQHGAGAGRRGAPRGSCRGPRGAPNGIGLVKLMGRNAGFIAAGRGARQPGRQLRADPRGPLPA